MALYAFEVILLLAMSITILARGGNAGPSAAPFHWPGGSTDVLLTFSLAVLAFGGFEAAAPLAEETENPRRNVPIAVIGAVVISGVIYVLGSYALVTAFGVGHAGVLAADPNPFRTAAKAFIPFAAPLITWIFLSSVTSSYVAANTQTSRVIYAGARGGLWSRSLAGISPGSAPRPPPRSPSSRRASLPWLTLALIAAGVIYQFALGAVRPAALRMAPALLEGDENQASADAVPTAG